MAPVLKNMETMSYLMMKSQTKLECLAAVIILPFTKERNHIQYMPDGMQTLGNEAVEQRKENAV